MAVSGHFKGKRGWISRVNNDMACVCYKNVWEFGIWAFITDLKITRRGR